MDTRRLLKRISWTVIGIAFIASICMNVLLYRQTQKLDNGFTEQVSHSSTPAADPVAGTAAGMAKTGQKTVQLSKSGAVSENEAVEALKYQLQAAEDELDMVHEDLNKEMDRKAEQARLRRESYKKMARERIASRNAGFFEAFNISPEGAGAFNDILMAEQMAYMELNLESGEIANHTESDRERVIKLYEELNAEYKAQKIELLGEAVYEEYSTYQKKRFIEENQVGEFSESLDSNEKLTDTQRTALVDAIAEAQEAGRKEIAAEINETENTFRLSPEQIDEANMERLVEREIRRRNEDYVAAARGILTPSQLEQFEAYLDQEPDGHITNMRVSVIIDAR